VQTRPERLAFAIVFGCAVLNGCPSSAAPDGGKAGAAGGHARTDAGAADSGVDDDAGMVVCPADSIDSTTFVSDMKVVGDKSKITGRLVKAMPAPPERYNNQWTVEFDDSDGKPLDDVELTKADAFMPYHNHGKPAYSMTKASEPGRFEVGINLFMRGFFSVRFTVSSPTAGDDMVEFKYCVRQ
jgi:hypothetical protein